MDIAVALLLQLVKMLPLDGITLGSNSRKRYTLVFEVETGGVLWIVKSCFLFVMSVQIVTLGMPSVSPIERVGTYVSPEEWNELISDPETVSPLFTIL